MVIIVPVFALLWLICLPMFRVWSVGYGHQEEKTASEVYYQGTGELRRAKNNKRMNRQSNAHCMNQACPQALYDRSLFSVMQMDCK